MAAGFLKLDGVIGDSADQQYPSPWIEIEYFGFKPALEVEPKRPLKDRAAAIVIGINRSCSRMTSLFWNSRDKGEVFDHATFVFFRDRDGSARSTKKMSMRHVTVAGFLISTHGVNTEVLLYGDEAQFVA